MFLAVTIGATIAFVQSVDIIKEPLTKSMTKYDPNSSDAEDLDITRAWDDVQREVRFFSGLTRFSTTNLNI